MAPSHGMESFDHSTDEIKEKKELLYGANPKRIYPVNRITVEAKQKLIRRTAQQAEQKQTIEGKATRS